MPAQTVDAQFERMPALLRAGRVYEFLHAADGYLKDCPDDDHVRILAVREFLALHLVAPARELFLEAPHGRLGDPQFAELKHALDDLRAPPVAWERFGNRFDANLAALSAAGRSGDAERIREAWHRRSGAFQLLVDCREVWHVRRRDEQGRWRWYPAFADHLAAEEARPLPEGIRRNTPGPFLFEGLGHGRFFERVYHATLDTFLGYSCPLYILEPDAAAAAVAMHLFEGRETLADRRVMLFLGEDCLEALCRRLDAEPDLPWPQQVLALSGTPPGGGPWSAPALRRAVEDREAAVRRSLADLESRYAARDIRHWATRFAEALEGRGPALRILAAVSTHTTFLQYSMRDARRAFESLGCEMRVLTEARPYTIISPLTCHNAIRDFDPDLFFVLDHLRPECDVLVPHNLPILTWDQDQLPHVFTKANLERIAAHDFVAGWAKALCLSLGCERRQFLHARIPTCPEQFGGDPLTEEETLRYACDVSYVSHASQTAQAFHEEERACCGHPGIARLLDVMYELLPGELSSHRVVDGGVMSYVLGEACRRCGVASLDDDLRTRLCRWYLWRLGDRMFRHEALEWVADWARQNGRSFRIYGNGWDKHATLSEFAAGPAVNGRELLCIYRASRINLQLMPAGFVHQRSLDGLAAGGFFLGRLVPDDLRGRTLRRLVGRIKELSINSTAELLEHEDGELRRLLREYLGDRIERLDPSREDLFDLIHINAELVFPDEVLSDLREILFDSAEEFAARADRFLADSATRSEITDRMRAAVVEHFSYRPTMRRFLEAMGDYLRFKAGGAVSGV